MSALRNENYEYDRLYYGGQARQAGAAREVRRGGNEQKRNVRAKGNVRYISASPAEPVRRQERPYKRAESPRQKTAAAPARRVREEAEAIPMQDAREVAAQKRTALKNIATILVVFALLAVVITRYAAISANNVENYELSKDVSAMEDTIKDLNLKLSLKNDLETIKDTAATQLGMGFPEKDQTRYIEFTPAAKNAPAETEAENPKGFIDVISGWFETVKGWFE